VKVLSFLSLLYFLFMIVFFSSWFTTKQKNCHGPFIFDEFIILYFCFVFSNGYTVLLSLCDFLLAFQISI